MPIYRCNSCGATTDTEATARALGYGPGTRFIIAAPTKCGICGSTNISEIQSGQPVSKPSTRKISPSSPTPTDVSKPPINVWALASFVLSLLSFCGGLLTGIPAIVLGFIALRKMAASEGQTRGKELAWGGIIVGSILAAVSIFLILVALLSDVSVR